MSMPEPILVSRAGWRDYYELTKPRVVALLLLTAVIGMFLAIDPRLSWFPDWQALVFGTLGIALASASAAVVNQVLDQRIDAIMARTLNRPIPQGKVDGPRAWGFALLLAVLSMLVLALLVNPLTAALTFFALIGYAFIYTGYLKRATTQNIVIGGLSGAAPPLLGWAAVSNSVHPYALLLVLIIFVWTPPHFWALAIHRKDDYAKADIPMLPVVFGVEFTKTCVLWYTVLLLLTTLLPYLTGMSGLIYLVGAVILGIWFLIHAWKLKFGNDPGQAMATFRFSIVYLMALFVVLLVDHYWS